MNAPAFAVPGPIQLETETQPKMPVEQQQDIANLAFALWQQRGRPEGSPEQDWIEAERRVRNEGPSTLTRR